MAEIIELFLAFQGVLRLITKALVAGGMDPMLALYLPDYGVLVVGLGLWAVVLLGGRRNTFIAQTLGVTLFLAGGFALVQAIWMLGWWVLWVSGGWVVGLLVVRIVRRRKPARIAY